MNPPCCGREKYLTQAADGYSLGHVSRMIASCVFPVQACPGPLLFIKWRPEIAEKTGSHTQLILLKLSTTRNKKLLKMQSFALVGLLAVLFTSGVTAGPYKRWGFIDEKL